MALEIVFSTSGNVESLSKGTTLPSWVVGTDENNVSTNKNTWYRNTSATNAYYFHNQLTNGDERKLFMQYGENATGWASTRFIREYFLIDDIELLPDMSYNVKGKVNNIYYKTRNTDFLIAGVRVNVVVTVNNVTVFNYAGLTSDIMNLVYNDPIPINVNVPVATENTATSFRVKTTYPNGEFSNTDSTFGFVLKNTNPPNYIPASIYYSKWETLNVLTGVNAGFTNIRDTTFKTLGFESMNTILAVNQGNHRIMENGQWKQLPPM